MRKTLMLGVVALAVALGVPATASAHHLEQDTSTIDCVLVNNAPTLQIHAQYRDFAPADLPVYVTVTVDRAVIAGGNYTLGTPANPVTLPDFPDNKTFPLTPGTHDVIYDARWPGNYAGVGPKTVTCPAPVPPSVLCNGVPVAPGTNCVPAPLSPPPVTLTCNGAPAPAGTTVCATPPKRPAPCVQSKLSLRVAHRHRVHGEQAYVVKGIGWRHVKWVHWSVRRPGGHWRTVGTSGRPWEHVVNHGLKWRIYLWVERVWGYPQWGRHQIRAKVRVKGVCGVKTIIVKRTDMNHDPEPRAHAWN